MNEYYVFGGKVPNRCWEAAPEPGSEAERYRYGFNGKEEDTEVSFGIYAFEARMYDGRLGRFFSRDPRSDAYAWQTPYSFGLNSPISHVDNDGEFGQLIIQYGVNVGINIAMQMAMSYMFDSNVKTFGQAWEQVNFADAFFEGAVDMLGSEKLQMATNAVWSLASYVDQVGLSNVTASGLIGAGFMGLIEPMLGSVISKYGTDAVTKGLKKIGLSNVQMGKLGLSPIAHGVWETIKQSFGNPVNAHYQAFISGKGLRQGAGYKKGTFDVEEYVLTNNGLTVKFDGYKDGFLLDAKGGYDQFIKNGDFQPWIKDGLLETARKQAKAAGDTPIRWHFMEEQSANLARGILKGKGYGGKIEVIYTPMPKQPSA